MPRSKPSSTTYITTVTPSSSASSTGSMSETCMLMRRPPPGLPALQAAPPPSASGGGERLWAAVRRSYGHRLLGIRLAAGQRPVRQGLGTGLRRLRALGDHAVDVPDADGEHLDVDDDE